MDTFPLKYTFSVDEGMKFNNTVVTFDSQKKQVQQHGVNPIETWKIQCRGTDTDRQTLKNFWKAHGGNAIPFYFYDPDGAQRIVRFGTDQYTGQAIREFDTTSPTNGTVVGFTATIDIELVL